MCESLNKFYTRRPRIVELRVLTITATFPSLIQPWLVNQLVQIIENGGENRILARHSETKVYNSNIDRYRLIEHALLVPDSKMGLIKINLGILFSLAGSIAFLRGIARLPRVLLAQQFTLKEKLLSFLMIPYMGLADVDVIHSHSEMAGNRFMPIIYALAKPLVITFHGLPPAGVNPITREQRGRYAKQSSFILVNTDFAKKQYVSLGADETKIRILPQGTDLEKFPFRARTFPENNTMNILTVGRFHPDKGQQYAISAIASLIKDGFKIKYRLVGNGPERERLQQLGRELEVEEHIEFFSQISDEKLQEIYDDSHIFILPSLTDKEGLHEETQGVVLQEAQASGLITIATRAGGIPECIDDGVSGFLVEDRSEDAIKRQLIDIIHMPERWVEIQLKGRQWVEEKYSIRMIGKKINRLYQSLL